MAHSPFYPTANFLDDLGKGYHNLNDDPLRIFLALSPPTAPTFVPTMEIATSSGGYGPSGTLIGASWSASATIANFIPEGDITWNATSGTGGGAFFNGFGPFRYVGLFNAVTSGNGKNRMIGYWDYGQPVELQDGESFKVDFSTSIFTITVDTLLS